MLFEQQPSEGGVSEARSRAAVIQGPATLLEQLEEDVQSYDANSPANARSQFSIAVSCEGAVPAASGHRTVSNGGESVESVADPAEGEHSSMPVFPSSSFLSITRRQASPTRRLPGSPEARQGNSVISKAHMQEISGRGGTPASVYAQGAVLPTPPTRASSPQHSKAQSSSGSEAGHPGKRKRDYAPLERLEGQASVPLHFTRPSAEMQRGVERTSIKRRSLLRSPGERSVDAMRKGDSQENADGVSIAGPTPSHAAGEWQGFAGAGSAYATTPAGPAAEQTPVGLQNFPRTAASRALNGKMGRPNRLSSSLGPMLLPKGSILGQPHALALNGHQQRAIGLQAQVDASSPRATLYVGESLPNALKQEGTEAASLGVQTAAQAPNHMKSRSSAEDGRQTMRDCVSTETTASRRGLAETDSHMPDQDQHARHGLNHELQRYDSVIAKIVDDSLLPSQEPNVPLVQPSNGRQAVSWQGSALQETGGERREETYASQNAGQVEDGGDAGEEDRADSLSNAWPARAIVVSGMEAANEAGLVAQSEPSRPAEGGPQPALTIFANEGLAGPKIVADDGAVSPYPAPNPSNHVQDHNHEQAAVPTEDVQPRSQSTDKGKRSSPGPEISLASNM